MVSATHQHEQKCFEKSKFITKWKTELLLHRLTSRIKLFTRSTDFLPAIQSSREVISFRSGSSEKAERNDYQMTTIIVTNNFKN